MVGPIISRVEADWITNAYAIEVTVGTCGGEPEATIEETASSVTITVTSTYTIPAGDGCSDPVLIDLKEPLGDRAVIDGATGEEI